MSVPQRLADTLARLLGLPESRGAAFAQGASGPRTDEPKANPEGTTFGQPTYGRSQEEPSGELITVRHPDGRMSSYPPPSRWDDWVEWESTAWPRKVARRYTLVPTICFNCESGCGLLAYVDKTTFEIRKFEGNPEQPGYCHYEHALVATQHDNGTDNRTELAVGLKQLTGIAACLELMCRVPK